MTVVVGGFKAPVGKPFQNSEACLPNSIHGYTHDECFAQDIHAGSAGSTKRLRSPISELPHIFHRRVPARMCIHPKRQPGALTASSRQPPHDLGAMSARWERCSLANPREHR